MAVTFILKGKEKNSQAKKRRMKSRELLPLEDSLLSIQKKKDKKGECRVSPQVVIPGTIMINLGMKRRQQMVQGLIIKRLTH